MRKPSERTNRMRSDDELNLTSMMDIITNLMFFLLLFANVIPVVIIDAPLPKIATTAEEVRMAKEQDPKLEVIVRIRNDGFMVQTSAGSSRVIGRVGKDYPFEDLHKFLVGLHQRNSKVHDVTLIPGDDINYDTIVRTMDAAREYVKGDPGFKDVPPDIAGRPESQQFNRLFSDVSLGGV